MTWPNYTPDLNSKDFLGVKLTEEAKQRKPQAS